MVVNYSRYGPASFLGRGVANKLPPSWSSCNLVQESAGEENGKRPISICQRQRGGGGGGVVNLAFCFVRIILGDRGADSRVGKGRDESLQGVFENGAVFQMLLLKLVFLGIDASKWFLSE